MHYLLLVMLPKGSQASREAVAAQLMKHHAREFRWRIGGRFDGRVTGAHRYGLNPGAAHEELAPNTARVRDVAGDDPPFAVVTPDGTWLSLLMRGEPVTPELREFWRSMRGVYAEHLAVGVDCHE